MTNRKYDAILYGASGFTGRQTVDYFAQHAPAGLNWAIAGRNRARLEAVNYPNVDILVADGADNEALNRLASQACVVATTAGPFALYGTPLVEACVRNRTHYVDITGETPWIRRLIDRFHAEAEANQTRIIPCCGFDSIPSDYGAHLVAQHLKSPLRIHAYFQMGGGLNGGTLATAFHQAESGEMDTARDSYLLNPAGTAPANRVEDPVHAHFDQDAKAWVAPFVMGSINTRVVRRTQALLNLPSFEYLEYQKFSSAAPAYAAAMGGAMLTGMIHNPLLRGALKAISPKPGQGPSEDTMNNGWFQCDFIGVTAAGERAQATVGGQGDPGNRITVKCLCESAILLATGAADGVRTGGILTPVSGLGDALLDRLRKQGMKFGIST
jgi:short subunit dehydrogenase-like uncharacterized protein